MITKEERNKLQNDMWDKMEEYIEKINEQGKLNFVEYIIARDVMHDVTVLHSQIDYDNNIAEEILENEELFLKGLNNAYKAFKRDCPDLDAWDSDSVNDSSMEYVGYAYCW